VTPPNASWPNGSCTASSPKPSATAGALSAVRSVGEPLFDSDEVRLLRAFAEQAALAIELARGRDDRQQLALAADRERIARDLHDHVIQRLFAVGMSLEAASGSISDAATLRRITSAVDQLDSTVREIRAAIFALEVQARRGESSVRARLADVAAQAASALGFAPRVYFEGPVDSRIPTEVAADVLAVVREALSNTARHAAATSVSVVVAAHDEVVVTVTDDGRGMRGATRTSGLANMRVRAEHRGGKLWVDSPRSGGTTVQWRVPLPV
jgi:signal transduction histidine kinase